MIRRRRPTFTPIDMNAEFVRGLRRACDLSDEIHEQLAQIPASTSGGIQLRPCSVTLADGTRHDNVYVSEVRTCLRRFGAHALDRLVTTKKVVAVTDSPLRLPAPIANRIYQTGETGMGYFAFDLVLVDGRVLACQVGDAVDFVDLPTGVRSSDVVDVRVPSAEGRLRPECQWLPYQFALYRDEHTRPDEPFSY